MKRLMIFAFVFSLWCAVFFGSIASAQSCTDDNEFFSISSQNNAHVELWNKDNDNYNVRICYGDYFTGTNGAPGNRDSGTMLKLSSDTNAHAEKPDGSAYNILAYHNAIINCQLISAGQQCNSLGSEYTRIVFLSSEGNAHVGIGGYTDYNYKLCCKANDPPICNYNTFCDSGDGENQQNCDDCGGGGGGPRCGDGSKNQEWELCDDGDSGDRKDDSNSGKCIIDDSGDSGALLCQEAECVDGYLSIYGKDGEQGGGDDEECDDDNTVNDDACDNSCQQTGTDFCSLYAPYTTHYPDVGCDEGLCEVQLCQDYEKVEEPEDGSYTGGETEFREDCCNEDCANVGGYSGGACEWVEGTNGEEDHCDASITEDDGTQCKIRYKYIGECNGDETKRKVEIYVEKVGGDGECDLPSGCAEWGDPPDNTWCSTEIPCPKSIQLPFFDMKNFLVAIALVVIVYAIYFTRKNAKK